MPGLVPGQTRIGRHAHGREHGTNATVHGTHVDGTSVQVPRRAAVGGNRAYASCASLSGEPGTVPGLLYQRGGMRLSAIKMDSIVEFVERLFGRYFEHRVATYAAALAYRGLFSLFPFLLIVVVLVGMLGPPNTVDRLIDEVKTQSTQQVPQQLQPVVEQGRQQIEPLEEIIQQAERQAQGELLVFGIVVALWSVSSLAGTLIDAFNTAYEVVETRRWWKVSALSAASGPLLAIAVIVAILLMLAGPSVIEAVAGIVGLRESFVFLWGWLRFPVALVLLWAALTIIYRYGSVARVRLGNVALGAALAVILWAIASVGFSVYLANFADYGVTYGSLGAAVGLLLYFYISASIVLVGAEFNAAIHPPVAGKVSGAENPDPDQHVPTARDGRPEDA